MENLALWGTIVNTAAVLLGSLVGLCIMYFGRAKRRRASGDMETNGAGQSDFSQFLFRGLGLCVVFIGLSGALEGTVRQIVALTVPGATPTVQSYETLIVILSMVLGAIIGHLLDLDGLVNRFGNWLERRFKGRYGKVSEGFVTASLLFCVGAMSINGAFASGMNHDHSVQYVKSLLDGISSIIFASTLGFGVMLSAGVVLLYQGSLSLIAAGLGNFLSEAVKLEMNVVGSLLIVGLGLNLLGVTKLKVMNYLPAMFLPMGLVPLFDLIFA